MPRILSVNVEVVKKAGWRDQTVVTISRSCGHTTNWSSKPEHYPRVGRFARCISCHLDEAEYQVWACLMDGPYRPEITL